MVMNHQVPEMQFLTSGTSSNS